MGYGEEKIQHSLSYYWLKYHSHYFYAAYILEKSRSFHIPFYKTHTTIRRTKGKMGWGLPFFLLSFG